MKKKSKKFCRKKSKKLQKFREKKEKNREKKIEKKIEKRIFSNSEKISRNKKQKNVKTTFFPSLRTCQNTLVGFEFPVGRHQNDIGERAVIE
jgi:hypothetical protein